MRICDFVAQKSPPDKSTNKVAQLTVKLIAQLQKIGIYLPIKLYWGDAWYVPEDTSCMSLPFYLLNKNNKIAQKLIIDDQGGLNLSASRCVILHELGHVFDHLYCDRSDSTRIKLFGDSATSYPELFLLKKESPTHWNLGQEYCQTHPDELFAEVVATIFNTILYNYKYCNKKDLSQHLFHSNKIIRSIHTATQKDSQRLIYVYRAILNSIKNPKKFIQGNPVDPAYLDTRNITEFYNNEIKYRLLDLNDDFGKTVLWCLIKVHQNQLNNQYSRTRRINNNSINSGLTIVRKQLIKTAEISLCSKEAVRILKIPITGLKQLFKRIRERIQYLITKENIFEISLNNNINLSNNLMNQQQFLFLLKNAIDRKTLIQYSSLIL
jgi:hypothetical protein